MKNITIFTRFFTLVFVLLFFATSCDQDPLEDVNLIVNLDIGETVYAFTIIDAATKNPVGFENGDTKVTVTVTGPDADNIIDIVGPEGPIFDAPRGLLSLALRPGVTVSENDPLDFNVIVHADGYFSTSTRVYMVEQKKEAFVVSMVSVANPPEGVKTVVDESISVKASGEVRDSVEIQTEIAGAGGSAKIIVPKDIIIKDKDGNLLTGALTATVGYFSHMDESAMEAFPGGMIANVDNNGTQEEVSFISAGFVAIEITNRRGDKAKTFENGALDLTVEIPTTTINPETGVSLQPGEIIPLWSYDEETGIWSSEGEGTVTGPNVNGMLEIETKLVHLSYWNWDWKYGPVCFSGGEICIKSNGLPDGTVVRGLLCAYDAATGQLLKRSTAFVRVGDCVRLIRVPSNRPVNIVFKSWIGEELGRVFIPNLCVGSHDLFVGEAPQGQGIIFDCLVTVSGFCPSQPSVLIRPRLWFWYRNVTRGDILSLPIEMINGQVTIPNVVVGDTYAAYTTYNGVFVEQQRLITSDDPIVLDNLQFTPYVCTFLGF